jgi:SAM-dependent methyltransferase
MKMYDKRFFSEWQPSSFDSAEEIVPVLISYLNPQSVVDVGCGIGTWLKAFNAKGVVDYLGIDGNWVEESMLVIPPDRFKSMDLTNPPPLGRQFSLAVSVEVAEHLPPEQGEPFVRFLTSLAPAVAFSAAIPGQGGTNHLNEQWQGYWASLFAKQGYCYFDVIRPRVWDKTNVCAWYAQNLLLYVREDEAKKNHALQAALEDPQRLLDVVNPRFFRLTHQPQNLSASVAFRALPYAGIGLLRRLVRSLRRGA